MRIFSNTLTESDVRSAFATARMAHGADIWVDDVRSFTPRKPNRYQHGTEVFAMSRNGSRPTGHRVIGSYPLAGENRAASWDAYGWVIAHLFAQDPDARIGWYRGVADFITQVTASHRREPKDFLAITTDPGARTLALIAAWRTRESARPASAQCSFPAPSCPPPPVTDEDRLTREDGRSAQVSAAVIAAMSSQAAIDTEFGWDSSSGGYSPDAIDPTRV